MASCAFQTIGKMQKALSEGEYSSVELLEAMLEQISLRNTSLNAIVTMDEQHARQQAQQADEARARGDDQGLLHGIPITIKDSFKTAGMRTTSGYPPLKDYIPEEDAVTVARLKAAGAIVIGKTNMPILAGDFQAKNPIFGRSNNPWDETLTTGGSTGGGAAALACGMTALELGSDLGGSARVPAHFCGVFGFKPGANRVSGTGHIPGSAVPGMQAGSSSLGFMATPGILSRSAADLRLGFRLLAGSDPAIPDLPPIPLTTSKVSEGSAKNYKIAWTGSFPGLKVSDEVRKTMASTALNLADAGHQVEETIPKDLDFAAAREAWGLITGSMMALGASPVLRRFLRLGFRFNGDHSDMNHAAVKGLGLKFKAYAAALLERETACIHIETFLQNYDFWMCPVTSDRAFPHARPGKAVVVDGQNVDYLHACGGHTSLFNLTGHPAVVLPAGQTADGLPLGVQLISPRWQDEMLLNAAVQLENIIGSFRPPPV